MLDKKVKIKELSNLGAGNYLLTLSTPEQARITQPGQFFMLKCVENINENPLLRRPISAFNIRRSARSDKPIGLEFLIKDVGSGTHKLITLKAGSEIFCLGPQGHGFPISAEMRHRVPYACLVAGGVGIGALYILAQNLISQGIKALLFYGGRRAEDLVLREHFEHLGMETFYATEDGSLGERGVVTGPLERLLKTRFHRDIKLYACGPWGMMKATHELAVRHQVACEVSLEARMGCSLGACMGCVVHASGNQDEAQYVRVCQEGPVMSSRAVDWEVYPL